MSVIRLENIWLSSACIWSIYCILVRVHHRSYNCVLSAAVSMFAKLSKLFAYSYAFEKGDEKHAVSDGTIDEKSARNKNDNNANIWRRTRQSCFLLKFVIVTWWKNIPHGHEHGKFILLKINWNTLSFLRFLTSEINNVFDHDK